MELGNKSAERNLLGSIMCDNSILDDISVKIKVTDLFGAGNRVVYEQMLKLHKEHKLIDLVTLADALSQAKKLDDVGGYSALMSLDTPTAANYKSYADIVKREAVRRDLAMSARQIYQMVEQSTDTQELLGNAAKLIENIDQGNNETQAERAGDIVAGVIEELWDNSEKEFTGLRTGFKGIDKMLDGFHPGELLILAARPAMGKTALALNIAQYISREKPVLIFSLEMSKQQLMKRLLSLYTGLSAESLKHPHKLTPNLQERIWQAGNAIEESKLIISDTAEQSLAAIKAITRQVKHNHKDLGLVVIDYLSLIKAPSNKGSREQEVAEISRSLKILAKEFDVPVLALAQVGRAAENRADKKPSLADLRESGAIEQDADVVMFIYREEYYNPASERKGQADIIIAKHRSGAVGDVALYFDAALTKFGNLDLRR